MFGIDLYVEFEPEGAFARGPFMNLEYVRYMNGFEGFRTDSRIRLRSCVYACAFFPLHFADSFIMKWTDYMRCIRA